MEPRYTQIKKGDSLSAIAKKEGISVAALADMNGITDVNKLKLGQKITLPNLKFDTSSLGIIGQNLIPNVFAENSYKVKAGDSLGVIAKKNNISVNELAAYNNIANINKLAVGDNINIPTKKSSNFSTSELKQSAAKAKYDNKKLYKGLDTNAIDNKQVVLNSLKGKEEFVLVDKKTNTLEKYDKAGNLISTFRVGLGKDKGDKFTINSKNKKVDRNTTPAGIYLVDKQSDKESYAHDYDNNILLLKSEAGLRQAASIHQVPNSLKEDRNNKISDTNLTNDDFSNGCVNCNKENFEQYLKIVQPGQKVVILPEEEGNYFTDTSGKLSFTTNKNKEFGQYNYTPKDKTGKALTLKSKKPTDIKNQYLNALSNEKTKLMADLGLSNDEYDNLAKRAYGILGQESNFGETPLNPMHDFGVENLYSKVFDDEKTRNSRSLGLTQIRPQHVNKEFAKKYGITADSLANPYQAAVATMERLADSYQAVKQPGIRDKYNNMTPENVYDYATTFYNKPQAVRNGEATGNNTYVQSVKKYAEELTTEDDMKKRKYAAGGDIQSPGGLDILSMGLSLVPGWGQIAGPAMGMISGLVKKQQAEKELRNTVVTGTPGNFATGGTIPLSTDSFQVKGSPNTTDGNDFNYKGAPIALDHDEVVDTAEDFVYSDDIINPTTGNSFAKDASKLHKAIGKAEKQIELNGSEEAKNTIKHSKQMGSSLASLQELLKTPMQPQTTAPQGFTKGGPLPWENFNVGDFQNWYNQMPGATPLTADGKWGPTTEAAYNKASFDYLNYTGKNKVNAIGGMSVPNYATNQFSSITPIDNILFPSSIGSAQKIPTAPQMMNTPDGPVDIAELGGVPNTAPLTMDQRATMTTPFVADSTESFPMTDGLVPGAGSSTQAGNLKSGIQLGDALQAFEVGSKFFETMQPAEKQRAYLDNSQITKQSYDTRPALQQNQRNFDNSVASISTPSVNLRRALTNNMQASKLNADSQTITQYDNMNKQALSTYEDKTSNRTRYNNQQQFIADDTNSRNRAAKDQAVQNAFTSLGNFGEALNRKDQSYASLNLLKELYPDVYDRIITKYNSKTTK